MTDNEITMLTTEEAFENYKRLVEDNDQAVPIVLYATAETVVPVALTGVGPGQMQPALRAVTTTLAEKVGPAEWVIHNAEAVFRAVPKDAADELENFEVGSMAEAFDKQGRDSGLQECVTITGVSRSGTKWGLMAEFRRNTDGTVTWEETQTFDDPQGGILDVLLEAVS